MTAAIAARALGWLAMRTKRVGSHIALHNSKQAARAIGRPRHDLWILNKGIHSVLIGGDRVTQKICEKTLKGFDSWVLQRNGNYAYTKAFGRQIGRLEGQTAFTVIVDASGAIVTGFAHAPAAAASTAPSVILGLAVTETIEGLSRIDEEYIAANPPREEGIVMKIIDFLMEDLGNEPAGEKEGMYLAEDRYRMVMENQYMSYLQELKQMSLGGKEREEALATFREGVAGHAAPYVEDEG